MRTMDMSGIMFGMETTVVTNGKFADITVTDPESGQSFVTALRADHGSNWTVRQFEARIKWAVGEAIVARLRRSAPKCPTCGDPLEGGNCHYCG